MPYKSSIARNLREIGRQLGVAHIVEGSVQRVTNKVRVNAQLIDARNDVHLWAQTYDRDLTDIFAIQSEIAKAIADQLQAKLSASEKKAIERPPTDDIDAFDLYGRAKDLALTTFASGTLKEDLLKAVDLLNQALARDQSFFAAQCLLARIHDQLYFQNLDHTPARLALAEASLDAALRLRPEAGEAHLARAQHLYSGHLQYEEALAELTIARRTLPNDPRVFELTGYITRRQGKQEEALHNLRRAIELDPRNLLAVHQLSFSYRNLRRYKEAGAVLDRALSIEPEDILTKLVRAWVPLDWKGDTRPLHQMLDDLRTQHPEAIKVNADNWFLCAIAERDAAAAERALVLLEQDTFGDDVVQFGRHFGEGLLARMTNDEAQAHAEFSAARLEQEKVVQADPKYGPALCVLGLIDAGLGRKEESLQEGRRAMELLPLASDSLNGAHMIQYFAIIAGWSGEKDLALEHLAKATQIPCSLGYGQLKLMPWWDPLRGDPRFEKIVASLAPKNTKP
jgi:tetratricopeptide (TPR) repeat protein